MRLETGPNEGRAVTVVIACHDQERLHHLEAAVRSVQLQEPSPEAIVITVDHEPTLHRMLVERFPELRVVQNKFQRGASGNRNTGALSATTPYIAFLDDDARARPGWLGTLVEPFDDPDVVATGGLVKAAWETQEPAWFPQELAWVVGASFRGLPTEQANVRNVWGENMAVRSDVFHAVGGFRQDFGKLGHVSRPEDTDLCIRMGKTSANARLKYVPTAVVDHFVGAERSRFQYFLKRSYFEGRGKVELARINGGNDDLGDEGAYLRGTIPQGVVRYIRQGVATRDANEFYRAGAVVAGIASAGVGAAISLLSDRKHSAGPAVPTPSLLSDHKLSDGPAEPVPAKVA